MNRPQHFMLFLPACVNTHWILFAIQTNQFTAMHQAEAHRYLFNGETYALKRLLY
jgi:elongation factor P--beta-lysine ligase